VRPPPPPPKKKVLMDIYYVNGIKTPVNWLLNLLWHILYGFFVV
jgi:hypothetical protein